MAWGGHQAREELDLKDKPLKDKPIGHVGGHVDTVVDLPYIADILLGGIGEENYQHTD